MALQDQGPVKLIKELLQLLPKALVSSPNSYWFFAKT